MTNEQSDFETNIEDEDTLTNRQGHPITNNQNMRTVGNRGPATLENYDFIEKISHFDRERVPERVVHARGAGAHGYFEAYGAVGDEAVSKYTRAKLFQDKGKRTPVFVRFSSVIHGGHSPETLRDPRGFAVKFYTEDGNWDLVGNNLKIFFIRDAIKFPDMIHAFKPDPITNIQDSERFFDFCASSPESFHMVTFIYSPWGIPANYRMMQGSGVNTYKWVNNEGEAVLVKYHWEPRQGIRNLTQKEAEEIQAKNFNHATQDLYDAIEKGDFPEWELLVQIMSDDEHPELDFDPLDDTKLWPEDKFPWMAIGKMVLDRNPEDYFMEVEQVAFGTGVLVDGLDFSDDKMLQGRTFSYSDTQRHRVGANYLQIPINAPKKRVATNQSGGQMQYKLDRAPFQNPHINYEPSILDGLKEAEQLGKEYTPMVKGNLVRQSIDRQSNTKQAGETYRNFEQWEKDELITNLINDLSSCDKRIQEKMIALAEEADEEYGRRLREGLAQDKSGDSSQKPLGNRNGDEAPNDAIQKSNEAEPY
ncbi:catalase [Psychrobacillus lasiicapitis]|uniref:catalase n=1 Tax=Psychrobacillus lasiicapitis TaxID=1636719 RepID=UPI001985CFA5|nr:catalase [Psychrobacillus lasiicapitis]GGA40320.1 catalase X [Psychrobacillus lasiicapitis]